MTIHTPNARDTWCPGLDNGRRTLAEIFTTLPGDPASSVPWYVRLVENPKSPVALPGAIDLFGHDCLHIVLGRGLLPQDEAFVLGFTMGASGSLSRAQQALFRLIARHLYRGEYRFTPLDASVFDLAVEVGRHAGCSAVHMVDFAALFYQPLTLIRNALGVQLDVLRSAYAIERSRWPNTPASRRLVTETMDRNGGEVS